MQKPDPMIPLVSQGQKTSKQWKIALSGLDMLYKFEKRDDPAHAKHGLYTGLNRKHSVWPGSDED